MLLFTASLLMLNAAGAAATCYSYEGKALPMSPCDGSGSISPCCGDNDFCLSNGLCLNAGGNNAYSQQGCTDKDWKPPCKKHCPGNVGKFGMKFCLMVPVYERWAQGVATSSTGSATASKTETMSTPTSMGSSKPESHGPNSTSDKSVAIGAGVGIPLGVALLAVIGVLIWQIRKRQATERGAQTTPSHTYTNIQQKPTAAEMYTPPPVSELETNEVNHR
ncbi:hypothetical protein PWT90_00441 [Aphanocladium album]|nr:hypothetical protein PWT90_00441 [Aphanocladium album]